MRKVRHRYFAVVAAVTALMVFAVPILAQMDDLTAGRVAGAQAARANTNETLWFAIGCLGGLIGVIIAYVIEPNPPTMMLLGKSPEYVAAYTEAYKTTAKSIQTKRAWTGCILGTVIQIALYALAAAAAGTTTVE